MAASSHGSLCLCPVATPSVRTVSQGTALSCALLSHLTLVYSWNMHEANHRQTCLLSISSRLASAVSCLLIVSHRRICYLHVRACCLQTESRFACRWLNDKNSCPVCRKPLNGDQPQDPQLTRGSVAEGADAVMNRQHNWNNDMYASEVMFRMGRLQR